MLSSRFVQRAVQQQQQRFYTPSIRFVYGNRAVIAQELANPPTPPWFVVWPKNAAAAVSQAAQRAREIGQSYTVGGKKTNVVLMEDGFFGNPFAPKDKLRQMFDEEAI
eukprot:UN09952